MNGLRFGKNALILSIMSFLTVLTWIGFEIYRTATATTIPEVTQEQMLPLNPSLNTELIEVLKNNLSYTEDELNIVAAMGSPSAVLGVSQKK